jgi:hypothetical protein
MGANRVISPNPRWDLFPNSLHVYARRSLAAPSLGPPAIRIDRLVALIGRVELRSSSAASVGSPLAAASGLKAAARPG